ncbi:MAG: DUF3152 domain-containing protein [Actinomadura rubrobrunea]|nr:DUF3152 domain-containing protein [Actinomadura rubrobrunea]
MEPRTSRPVPDWTDARGEGTAPSARDVLPAFDEELERSLGRGRWRRIGALVLAAVVSLLVAAAFVGIGAVVLHSELLGGVPSAHALPTTVEPDDGAHGASRPRKKTGPSASPSRGREPERGPYIPPRGTGEFTRPKGAKKTVGRGRLMRYMVEVEGGLGQDPAEFARTVDRILAHPRGWTAGGKVAFRRVDRGPYDFVVRLASPDTVDKLCAAYGLDTEGEVNCAGGKEVVVNLRRWLLLNPYYQGRPDEYRALVINHEVGHRLGYGHATCPGKGRPAPVMQQQIFGLKGCVANPWPYDRKGRFITGPSVP